MITLNTLLEKFSALLICYWDDISLLKESDPTGTLHEDWLQANWELLVESLINKNVVLTPYGDGADCNGNSSRVLYPARIPTHSIICNSLNNNPIYDVLNERDIRTTNNQIVFDRFVSIGDDGWYHEAPPFNCVLADYEGEYIVLNFRDLDFELLDITKKAEN